jgi:DNA-binding beta-propeller fold protein YncE
LPFIFNILHQKMKAGHLLLLFLAAIALLPACRDKCDDCPGPEGDYARGIFVVNEGPFGGTGTISWHNPDTGETQDSIFEKANGGAVLGQFVQSLAIHRGKAYIVVNGANRVVVADAATFKFQDTIGNLALPRYFLPIDDNFAYVSQWGADGLTGSVAKVDLRTNKVVKTIPTGSGPEKMLRIGGSVYVANAGGYGVDSTLTEIVVSSEQTLQYLLPSGKNAATLANVNPALANPIYLCKGYFLDPTPTGSLNRLNGTPATNVAAPAYSDDLLNAGNGVFYFIGGGQVYRANSVGNSLTAAPIFAQNAYGLGLDPAQNLLYCLDAKDFSSAGEVLVYKTDGTRIETFRAGVAPSEVLIVK